MTSDNALVFLFFLNRKNVKLVFDGLGKGCTCLGD